MRRSLKIDDREILNIHESVSLLMENNQKSLALSLLGRAIRQAELEANQTESVEKEYYLEIKKELEKRYSDVKNQRPGFGFLGQMAYKTAIAVFITVVLLVVVGGVGLLVVNKLIISQETLILRTAQNYIWKNLDEIHAPEMHRERFLSFITHNPAVHYHASLVKEKNGDIRGALQEIELAMGLVAPDIDAYKKRLEDLKKQLP